MIGCCKIYDLSPLPPQHLWYISKKQLVFLELFRINNWLTIIMQWKYDKSTTIGTLGAVVSKLFECILCDYSVLCDNMWLKMITHYLDVHLTTNRVPHQLQMSQPPKLAVLRYKWCTNRWPNHDTMSGAVDNGNNNNSDACTNESLIDTNISVYAEKHQPSERKE